jgi:hypothetical protein
MKTKQELLEALKCHLKGSLITGSIRLPEGIELESEDGCLKITMQASGIKSNMQNDDAAFEAWAIAIKSLLPTYAKTVTVCWRGGDVTSADTKVQRAHYTRFLYRAIRFEQSYDWAKYACLDAKADSDLKAVKEELTAKKWVANFPNSEAMPTDNDDEAGCERKINEILRSLPTIKANDHQLPVGLFFEKVQGQSEFERTPGGKSQLDLWSISDKKEFCAYELKLDKNRKVGIISELMFYVNAFQDIADGIIRYPEDAVNCKFRSFDKVYDAFSGRIENKVEKIVGVFLTNKLHPLIDADRDALLAIMNDNHRGISYKQMKYDDEKVYEA